MRAKKDRDLQLAKDVQGSFVPKDLPQVAGYEFFTHYSPASEVGGDYYGFVPLGPDRLASVSATWPAKGWRPLC